MTLVSLKPQTTMETTGRGHGCSSFSSAMPCVTVQHVALLVLCLQTTALSDCDLRTLSCPEDILREELTRKLPCPPAWDLLFMACAAISRCRLLSLSSLHDFPPWFSSSGDSMPTPPSPNTHRHTCTHILSFPGVHVSRDSGSKCCTWQNAPRDNSPEVTPPLT